MAPFLPSLCWLRAVRLRSVGCDVPSRVTFRFLCFSRFLGQKKKSPLGVAGKHEKLELIRHVIRSRDKAVNFVIK